MIRKVMEQEGNTQLSIIIPLYNVDQWLAECLDSLLKERAAVDNKIEIILFNDASTDKTLIIAEGFRDLYPKTVKLHNSLVNRGPGVTRNEALKLAKADYIWFFDGDDKAEDGIIDSILKNISDKPDAVYLPMVFFKNNKYWADKGEAQIRQYISDFGSDVILDRESRSQALNLPFAPWRLVFRKQCLKDAAFCPTGFTEDLYFFFKVIGNAQRLIFIREFHVCYRRRKGQITGGNHPSLWFVTDTFYYVMNDIVIPDNRDWIWNVFLTRFYGKMIHMSHTHPATYTLRFRLMICRFWRTIPDERKELFRESLGIGRRIELASISICLFPEVSFLIHILRLIRKIYRTTTNFITGRIPSV